MDFFNAFEPIRNPVWFLLTCINSWLTNNVFMCKRNMHASNMSAKRRKKQILSINRIVKSRESSPVCLQIILNWCCSYYGPIIIIISILLHFKHRFNVFLIQSRKEKINDGDEENNVKKSHHKTLRVWFCDLHALTARILIIVCIGDLGFYWFECKQNANKMS